MKLFCENWKKKFAPAPFRGYSFNVPATPTKKVEIMSLGSKQYRQAILDRDTMDPADWDLLGEYYVGESEEIADAYGETPSELIENECELGKCEHCSTWHNHGAGFKNRLTGQVLAVGRNCAEEFFNFKSTSARKVAQAAKAKERKAQREEAAEARQAALDANPGLATALECDHYIVNDIAARFAKWGNISEKQVKLVFKIAADVAARAAEKANEPEPVAIPAECLEGRQRFTGVVLGTKWVESDWGGSVKLLIAEDRGFKLWGSAPDSADQFKGATIAFDARVKASDKDACFGFYSRPTKWSIELVEEAAD